MIVDYGIVSMLLSDSRLFVIVDCMLESYS